jgi:hypothetical protein
MNGLEIIDLKKASFMDRVLRRQPRENAFVEINNLLACVPVMKLDRESIDRCLEKYEITHEKARSRLLNFYSIVLKNFLLDTRLEARELEKLHHLKHIFSLEDKEIGSIHKNLVQPVYKMHIRKAIADGELTEEEKIGLQKIAERLYIPKEFAKKLYVNEASEFLHSVLNRSIADGMLSDAEEAELYRLAGNLGVELKFSETAKKNLERFRSLWKIYNGELPNIDTSLRLPRGEKCAASVRAVHYQVNNSKVPVKYSGYHELAGQSDFGFHSGALSKDRMIGKVITFIDQGSLYFTNSRLLFTGTNGQKDFLYKNLTGGTFYENGLLIEQIRGRDQFFKFKADMSAIKLIFDSLITQSRK